MPAPSIALHPNGEVVAVDGASVERADAEGGPFTRVLDVLTLEHRRVEIVVENADAAFYRVIPAT